MIESFKHKGLKKFFLTGNKSGIQPEHESKLRTQLALLNIASTIEAVNMPGYDLHLLNPKKAGVWSIAVHANWKLTFTLNNENVQLLDYEDYH